MRYTRLTMIRFLLGQGWKPEMRELAGCPRLVLIHEDGEKAIQDVANELAMNVLPKYGGGSKLYWPYKGCSMATRLRFDALEGKEASTCIA